MRFHFTKHLLRDACILVGGIVLAILLAQSGLIAEFLEATAQFRIFTSFVSGMLFPIIITLAPASVALAALSEVMSPYYVALWGALGAGLVDLAMYHFVAKDLSRDVRSLMKPALRRSVRSLFHFGLLKWLLVISGAIVLAAPISNELGIVFLSAAKLKKPWLITLIFTMDYLGILIVIYLTRVLLLEL